MKYRIAYSIGFHPWEDAADDAAFVRTIGEMLDREEAGGDPPHGAALDIGTGSGIWAVELARRGWEVTAIDIVPTALERARRRAEDQGVAIKLVEADVTTLTSRDVGDGFRLLLDTGTFHDLDDAGRSAMGRTVTALAAPSSTLLMLVWPKRRRPVIRGATRAEIEEALPHWRISDVRPSCFRLPKILDLILRPDEHWYRLRRAGSQPLGG